MEDMIIKTLEELMLLSVADRFEYGVLDIKYQLNITSELSSIIKMVFKMEFAKEILDSKQPTHSIRTTAVIICQKELLKISLDEQKQLIHLSKIMIYLIDHPTEDMIRLHNMIWEI